jgi:hypothetical protein
MKTQTNHIEDNPDNECTNQDIAIALLDEKVIRGYGRRCCGMNGKNADLDPEGQCVVDQIAIIDPVGSDTLFIELYLNRYVNVCTPTDEDEQREQLLQECAENIILMTNEYSGEWTGSDYWCFNFTEVLRVPLTVEEYDNPDLVLLAERCADAIYNSEEGKEFEAFAKNLNESIDSLHNLCNTDLGI